MIPLRDDNPTHRPPVVTVILIALNVLIFLVEIGQGSGMQDFVWKYGFVPAELVQSRDDLKEEMLENPQTEPVVDRRGRVRVDPWSGRPLMREVEPPIEEVLAVPALLNLLTCMFLHGGWMHLIGNMLYLWIFGNNIEDRLGPIFFTIFYLVTGIAGSLAHTIFNAGAVPLVGASGAISGVMGAYIILFPHARIAALVPMGYYWFTTSLPAWIFLGIYFLVQNLFPAAFAPGQGGVAYLAHLGGFAAGAAMIYLFPHRKPPAVRYARPIDEDDVDLVI